jgi:hypothetical protein
MKRILLLSAFLISAMSFNEAKAQVSFSLNIGSQPLWGPTGYNHVEYYYLPDIDAYYYVPQRQFVYNQGGRWIFSTSLPPRYRNFDLYSGYKVVINEPRPYLRHNIYRQRYITYRGRRNQAIIRNSNDERYYQVQGHPRYEVWRRNHPAATPAQVQNQRLRQKLQHKNQVIQHKQRVERREDARERVEDRQERREDAQERREDRRDGRR